MRPTYLRCAISDCPNPEAGLIVHPRYLGVSSDEIEGLKAGTIPQARAQEIMTALETLTTMLYRCPVAGHA